jgi:hypothetical protein
MIGAALGDWYPPAVSVVASVGIGELVASLPSGIVVCGEIFCERVPCALPASSSPLRSRGYGFQMSAPESLIRERGGPPCQSKHITVAS